MDASPNRGSRIRVKLWVESKRIRGASILDVTLAVTVRAKSLSDQPSSRMQGRLKAIAVRCSKDKLFALCSVAMTFHFDHNNSGQPPILSMSKSFSYHSHLRSMRDMIVSSTT